MKLQKWKGEKVKKWKGEKVKWWNTQGETVTFGKVKQWKDTSQSVKRCQGTKVKRWKVKRWKVEWWKSEKVNVEKVEKLPSAKWKDTVGKVEVWASHEHMEMEKMKSENIF